MRTGPCDKAAYLYFAESGNVNSRYIAVRHFGVFPAPLRLPGKSANAAALAFTVDYYLKTINIAIIEYHI